MSLELKDIEHIAKLARLDLSETEKEKFTSQLGNILDFIENLNQVDTESIEPMLHSLCSERDNVLREDINIASVSHEQIIKNAPSGENRFFKVKKVIE